MKTEVCFCRGPIFQGLTLWLVGMIKQQASISTEPWPNVVTAPTPLPISGKVGHEEANRVTLSEPPIPPHPGRPVPLEGVQEVTTDAGRGLAAKSKNPLRRFGQWIQGRTYQRSRASSISIPAPEQKQDATRECAFLTDVEINPHIPDSDARTRTQTGSPPEDPN